MISMLLSLCKTPATLLVSDKLFQFYMDAYKRRIQSQSILGFYDYKFLSAQPRGLF